MTTLTEAQFVEWAVAKGLQLDPGYPQSATLTFHGALDHDVVHVVCKNPADIQVWVAGMEEAGFALPDVPPDATFKIPSWMKRSDG
jgi:hypothetical protein